MGESTLKSLGLNLNMPDDDDSEEEEDANMTLKSLGLNLSMPQDDDDDDDDDDNATLASLGINLNMPMEEEEEDGEGKKPGNVDLKKAEEEEEEEDSTLKRLGLNLNLPEDKEEEEEEGEMTLKSLGLNMDPPDEKGEEITTAPPQADERKEGEGNNSTLKSLGIDLNLSEDEEEGEDTSFNLGDLTKLVGEPEEEAVEEVEENDTMNSLTMSLEKLRAASSDNLKGVEEEDEKEKSMSSEDLIAMTMNLVGSEESPVTPDTPKKEVEQSVEEEGVGDLEGKDEVSEKLYQMTKELTEEKKDTGVQDVEEVVELMEPKTVVEAVPSENVPGEKVVVSESPSTPVKKIVAKKKKVKKVAKSTPVKRLLPKKKKTPKKVAKPKKKVNTPRKKIAKKAVLKKKVVKKKPTIVVKKKEAKKKQLRKPAPPPAEEEEEMSSESEDFSDDEYDVLPKKPVHEMTKVERKAHKKKKYGSFLSDERMKRRPWDEPVKVDRSRREKLEMKRKEEEARRRRIVPKVKPKRKKIKLNRPPGTYMKPLKPNSGPSRRQMIEERKLRERTKIVTAIKAPDSRSNFSKQYAHVQSRFKNLDSLEDAYLPSPDSKRWEIEKKWEEEARRKAEMEAGAKKAKSYFSEVTKKSRKKIIKNVKSKFYDESLYKNPQALKRRKRGEVDLFDAKDMRIREKLRLVPKSRPLLKKKNPYNPTKVEFNESLLHTKKEYSSAGSKLWDWEDRHEKNRKMGLSPKQVKQKAMMDVDRKRMKKKRPPFGHFRTSVPNLQEVGTPGRFPNKKKTPRSGGKKKYDVDSVVSPRVLFKKKKEIKSRYENDTNTWARRQENFIKKLAVKEWAKLVLESFDEYEEETKPDIVKKALLEKAKKLAETQSKLLDYELSGKHGKSVDSPRAVVERKNMETRNQDMRLRAKAKKEKK